MAKKARRGRGEGSIFYSETHKCWATFITVDRKRYYGYGQSKEAAKYKLLDLQAKAKQGLLGGKTEKNAALKTKTVEQVVRDYVNYWTKAGEIGPSTAQRYEGIIKGKIAPAFGALPVSDLTRQHIKDLYAKEYETNAPASVLKTHNLLSAALKEAVENKLVNENVCSTKLRPRVVKEEEEHFEEDEVNTLLSFTKKTSHRDTNLLIVAFRTGLRSGELLGLRWEDIDVKNRVLNVSHNLQNFGRTPTLGKTKNKKTRQVPLAPDALAALKAQKEVLLAEGHPRPWVFPNTEGNPGNRNHLLKRFKTLCKDAGVHALKVHATRHTFASLAIKAGVDFKTLQELLGHYSVALTIDTYGHLAKDAKRNAVEMMDKLFAAS